MTRSVPEAGDPAVPQRGRNERRDYQAPKLERFGRLSDLTRGGNKRTQDDHGQNNMSG